MVFILRTIHNVTGLYERGGGVKYNVGTLGKFWIMHDPYWKNTPKEISNDVTPHPKESSTLNVKRHVKQRMADLWLV